MVEIVSPLPFDRKVDVNNMISSRNKTYRTGDKENGPLQSVYRQANYYDSSDGKNCKNRINKIVLGLENDKKCVHKILKIAHPDQKRRGEKQQEP
jgi:hypothetical protein